ncbi:MAG: polyphosphate kinase 1 [Pyrinomonadaceae bacterium]|nr:polyphosphate kinase 1 [Pyrinomonadaceae bacterium]
MDRSIREFVPALPDEPKADNDGLLPVDDPRFLTNRELSWLEFNRRVLQQALDDSVPLLERLKFLSIFSTNLDEFFMIRVSGLKEQIAEGVQKLSPDGLTAEEQVREIRRVLRPMLMEQMMCLNEDVIPELEEQGIRVRRYADLNRKQRDRLNDYFLREVFPILTPQAVDESHPFPYISNLSLNLGLIVDPLEGIDHGKISHLYSEGRFVRIKLPPTVSRLVKIGDEDSSEFVALSEIVAANSIHLFPNMVPNKAFLFRLTRDADIEIREDEAGDLLRVMEQELLHRRRFSFPVRLEVTSKMPEEMISLIAGSTGLTNQDVYRIDGFLNISDMMSLYGLDRPDLKDKPISYSIPEPLKHAENVFDAIKEQDVLVHHPYTNYSTILDFLEEAATDEDVRGIKICLYRTGKNSPVVESLVKASRNGKQVAALVELKARFDEENNIEWARQLESEGVHVIYGMLGLKTHSKVLLVVRREDNRLRRYVHLATGNYNPFTSKLYTDIGILTADEEIGADASDLFNFLTGYSHQTKYRQLLVAPVDLRERMIELIDRETENKKKGRKARIIVKINSLTDDKIVRALYRASQAGVKIDLIVRGICVLKPGIEGLSENIRVVSIVGRFLEHSRIYYFANGGEPELFIGSADWMHRNLDRRVEAVTPIKDGKLVKYIRKRVLGAYLADNTNASVLMSDGLYQPKAEDEKPPFDAQMYFVGHDI